VRAALAWSVNSGQVVKGIQLVGELEHFWMFYESPQDRLWLTTALEHPTALARTAIRAKALYVASDHTFSDGDLVRGRVHLEESVSIWRELGRTRDLAHSQARLGLIWRELGDFPLARSMCLESITLFRQVDDPWRLALALRYLSNVQMQQGDYLSAQSSLMESLSLFRALGDHWGMSTALLGLGELATIHGDYHTANDSLVEAALLRQAANDLFGVAAIKIQLARAARLQGHFAASVAALGEACRIANTKHYPLLMARALHEYAMLASLQSQLTQALQLFSAVESHNTNIQAEKLRERERTVATLRAQLAATAFEQAWNVGHIMTLEQAVALAQQPPTSKTPLPTLTPTETGITNSAGLTEREVAVLRLLARGLSNAEIAEQLVLSPRTVGAHLRSIFSKLDVTTRTAAARVAIDLKLV
jgi:ATP/maltotriose-dependent transcriptional regulator MalT